MGFKMKGFSPFNKGTKYTSAYKKVDDKEVQAEVRHDINPTRKGKGVEGKKKGSWAHPVEERLREPQEVKRYYSPEEKEKAAKEGAKRAKKTLFGDSGSMLGGKKDKTGGKTASRTDVMKNKVEEAINKGSIIGGKVDSPKIINKREKKKEEFPTGAKKSPMTKDENWASVGRDKASKEGNYKPQTKNPREEARPQSKQPENQDFPTGALKDPSKKIRSQKIEKINSQRVEKFIKDPIKRRKY